MTKHYSGNGSREFWNRIQRLQDDQPESYGACYALGCALQDLEKRALDAIRFGEDLSRKKRRAKLREH